MKRYIVAVVFLAGMGRGNAQHWLVGGNVGVSTFGGYAGFQLTPVVEMQVNRNIGIGTEFSASTHFGAPVVWYPYFKYYFNINGSQLKPYASAGPVMAMNVPNGPSFGFLFGGGVHVPLTKKLSIVPDVQIGPVFGYAGGSYPLLLRGFYWGYETYGLTSISYPSVTVLAFSARAGIRYEI